MPLFMAISGYFVFYSLEKNSGLAVLRGRCISLGWIIFFGIVYLSCTNHSIYKWWHWQSHIRW